MNNSRCCSEYDYPANLVSNTEDRVSSLAAFFAAIEALTVPVERFVKRSRSKKDAAENQIGQREIALPMQVLRISIIAMNEVSSCWRVHSLALQR
jgi:hypothetical protein